jgi:hypothetical protein
MWVFVVGIPAGILFLRAGLCFRTYQHPPRGPAGLIIFFALYL